MKTVSKGFLPEILVNPISRNLIFILVATLIFAGASVTAAIIALDQW